MNFFFIHVVCRNTRRRAAAAARKKEKKKFKTAHCTLNLQIYSKVANERTIKKGRAREKERKKKFLCIIFFLLSF